MQLKKFSPAAQKVLIQSQALAKKNHNQLVEPEHLALALVMTIEVRELLDKKNLDYKSLEAALLESINKLPKAIVTETSFSARLIQSLSAAEAFSIAKNRETILTSDMFLSLLENKNKYGALGAVLAQYFLDEQRDAKKLSNKLDGNDDKKAAFLDYVEQVNNQIKNNALDPVFGRDDECDRVVQILSRKTSNNPLLIGEPGVGRTSIVYALVKRIVEQKVPSFLVTKEILSLDVGALVAGTTLRGQFEERMRKVLGELSSSPGQYILLVRDLSLLFGAGGEGASDAVNLIKPSLIKGDIQMIGLISPELYKKRIEHDPSFERLFQPIWINPPSPHEAYDILSGLKGNYERFHGVFIDDDALNAAIDLGSKHFNGRVLPEVALDILDEACARHRIAMDKRPEPLLKVAEEIHDLKIAISTLEAKNSSKDKLEAKKIRLGKLIEEEKKLSLRFNEELSLLESIRALKSEMIAAEQKIEQTRKKQDPDEAASIANNELASLKTLFKEKTATLSAIKKSARLIEPWVKRDDIAFVVSQETGIPVQKMLQSEKEKLSIMEAILGAKVIGQDSAVTAVSSAIRRARVGLKDPKKPIGSFLFLGPTGVGKTELARTLTSFLFDDERAMVRFDMSEFMERHSVARLLGSPPGYQGSEEGGQLTEAVRHKPFSVILFDEIEKAHVDVLNILLQVLDEGHLTDSKGRLVHFNNTVVIMTSNIGSDILLEAELHPKEHVRELIMERLLKTLRPEFVNRIDEVILFNAIDKAGARGIVELLLSAVQKRVGLQGYQLNVSGEAKEYILKEGYSREFGARPLKRTIQRLIETPLANLLVSSSFRKGDCIDAVVKDGEFVLEQQQL